MSPSSPYFLTLTDRPRPYPLPVLSLARLTHILSQTLPLLLERQHLESLDKAAPASAAAQITRNLASVRAGVLTMEQHEPGFADTALAWSSTSVCAPCSARTTTASKGACPLSCMTAAR